MNGVGNKILVLDLRGARDPPTPQEARAIHRAESLDFDQMMALGDPRSPERCFVLIYNNDGNLGRRLRQRNALRRRFLARETGAKALRRSRPQAGRIACERLGART